MNIVCVICSELLVPSDDVYHTPCGHIFHFQCLQKWFERSNTCPQCRERTTPKHIHRIYFNFSNDDSIVMDNTVLQSTIDSLRFQLTLGKEETKNLRECKEKLELKIVPLEQQIKLFEKKLKDKNSTIAALKEQLQYFKLQCADVAEKDHEIKTLNKELEKLQSVQTLINASADEVDDMMKSNRSDPSTLRTYISVLKRELDNSIIQKKQLRDKLAAKKKESVELSQVRNKMRQLKEMLEYHEEEAASMQTKLLEIQTAASNCKCKIAAEIKQCPEESDKEQEEVLDLVATKHTTNSCNSIILKDKEDSDCIVIINNAENTPQNIKSQGFFSMTNRNIKRINNNTTVPSILTKKLKFNESSSQKTSNSGMTFDGFGGHAKYDKFPKPVQGLHLKTSRDKFVEFSAAPQIIPRTMVQIKFGLRKIMDGIVDAVYSLANVLQKEVSTDLFGYVSYSFWVAMFLFLFVLIYVCYSLYCFHQIVKRNMIVTIEI
ncbi:PREDICTED: E3 ubiquitin-protein ligase TRAIP-like isoform X4 [Dinoponera quadriceps]|uniref:E3 ubiquitin-protein ligase TRAIP-like isoform X4 n=1 Tax=Dinoponera quadriceps TaxID=609295 RepID=A0A6P3YFT3_DINQU|nr:PREDICTED: E3 ubiquitin-protein ligase TRAIP-like isoform X4 [Dinoponera quadriceps]